VAQFSVGVNNKRNPIDLEAVLAGIDWELRQATQRRVGGIDLEAVLAGIDWE